MVTRIRQLLDTKQLTPTQFADFIGVGRPVMSHILSERNKPSLEVVQRIISAFPEVSLPWLLSGLGEMLGEASFAAPATPPAEEHPVVATQAPGPAAPTEEAIVASESPEPEAGQPLLQAPSLVEEPMEAGPVAPVVLPTPTQVAPVALHAAPAAPRAFPVGPQALPTGNAPAAAPSPVSPLVSEAVQPVRAARFVPATTKVPTTTPRRPLVGDLPASGASAVAPASAPALLPPAADTLVASMSTVPAATKPAPEATLLPFLGEPGKDIRRIVIFYRDGSFADYQPEV